MMQSTLASGSSCDGVLAKLNRSSLVLFRVHPNRVPAVWFLGLSHIFQPSSLIIMS
jgi:hypothetical protein